MDVLLGRQKGTEPPQSVLCIVDAAIWNATCTWSARCWSWDCNVIALNMMDVAAARGSRIDAEELSRRLRIPVIPIQANRKRGLEELKRPWPTDRIARSSIRCRFFPLLSISGDGIGIALRGDSGSRNRRGFSSSDCCCDTTGYLSESECSRSRDAGR